MVPVVIDHAYGGLPPLTTRACEYAPPTVPPGKAVVVMAKLETMLMLKFLVEVADALSVTWTPKLKLPPTVGVPLITPVAGFKLRPAGMVPATTSQW